MDPLSIASGVAGLISLASSVGSTLWEIQRDFRGAKKSCARLAAEVDAISDTLGMLQTHISRVDARASTLLHQPVQRCTKELEKIQTELTSGQKMTFRRKLSWAMSDERRISEFIDGLEHYKTIFTLALQVDNTGRLEDMKTEIAKLRSIHESGEQRSADKEDEDNLVALLKWLKPLDMVAAMNKVAQRRQPGTCQWVYESAEFRSWRESSGSLLWLHGIAGSGKSVISSAVVKHLLQERAPDEVVLYAFCDFREPETTDPSDVLCTLLADALRWYKGRVTIDFAELIEDVKKMKGNRSVEELIVLILKTAQRSSKTFIVIDGLDECENRLREDQDYTDREAFLGFLLALASDNSINIFVASRPEHDIAIAFGNAAQISLLNLKESRLVSRDIVLHVDREVETRPKLARLSNDLKSKIRAVVSARACGMFRLVQCQLDLLAGLRVQKKLLDALDTLPVTLYGVYDRILARIESEDVALARRALRWIVDAKSPIRLAQVAEAVTIEAGASELNEDYKVMANEDLVEILSSLVTHNSQDDLISLSHFSVLDYLLSSHLQSSRYSIYRLPDLAVLSDEMLALLVDYMLIDAFNRPPFLEETDVQHFLVEHPFYAYAGRKWVAYCPGVNASAQRTSDALIRFVRAATFCPAVHTLRTQVWYSDLGTRPEILTKREFYDPLRWLVEHRIPPAFLAKHIKSLNPSSDLLQCCVFVALWQNNVPMLEVLLDVCGANVNGEHFCRACERNELPVGRTPLACALEAGALDCVRALLARGADATATMSDGWTALHSASKARNKNAVQMLLDAPRGIDIHARDHIGRTPLLLATADDVEACLLDHGAEEDLDLFLDTPKERRPEEVLEVGLCLSRMLHGALRLVSYILDLAEYWAVTVVRRDYPRVLVQDGSPDRPYVSLKLNGGRRKQPLRHVMFTTESHDQGWSESYIWDIGTYVSAYSWFEAGKNNESERKRVQNNLHGSPKKRFHRNIWMHGVGTENSNWLSKFRNGDTINVYPKAQFPGWLNYVYSVELVAYTACI
ncbi:hypothetical protein CYLTODRAFT_488459 [Cylindrobasidium torrendii FP15055 ss-10]|uniref:Uncharacterized protein n=1 Tax=Cylindrobasidium torrendii FP15055 ss-10 TaxID=1314674 RepID=A0A0D7BHC5_9AGAR|nr:hypothetical protein CYLTODRAFT_488459 [Cylindrobasidium torrendii FP15055 ss-10]